MAQIIGKWKGDPSGYTKASGLPDDIIEKFRNATNFMEMKKDKDNWTLHFTSDAAPSRTYEFQSGKEQEVTDPFQNKKMKFTITIVSDNKMTIVESSEISGWKPVKMSYEVKDNKLMGENVLSCGTKMKTVMNRC